MEDRKSYVVTAHKPTSVSHSVVGRFTGANDVNLILAKTTRIEIHLLTPEGLAPVHDVAIYGRITMLEVFRPANSSIDLLFVCTQRFQFCVLGYDATTKTIVTRAQGNIRDTIGRVSDVVTGGNVDPEGRLIGMNLYEGYFKVIPMDANGKLADAYNIRMDELRVIDVKFLYGCAKPTICVLYEDKKGRHVKTYVIMTKEKEFAEGPWSQSHVESSANMLIPAPVGGVLIVSQQMIVYHNGTTCHAISMQSTIIQVYGQVDRDRFLLADQFGLLQVVALQMQQNVVTGIALEVLGETSIASSLSYLDNGVVFVGSGTGDSQLIKLLPARDPTTRSYIEVLDSYVNIGPIVDFTVMDLDRQGQGQVVTCSGAYKDGSLRIIRNGIGINEQAATELAGIKGMWALRHSFAAEQDAYLVQSFVSETRVLGFASEMDENDVELAEIEIPGLGNTKTLLCRNVVGDFWLQVTEFDMRLISCSTMQVVTTYKPEGRITVAAANPTQAVIALAGGVLLYFEITNGQLVQAAQTRMAHEIACLDISPLGTAKNVDGNHWETQNLKSSHVSVGLWSELSVSLLSLPSLSLVYKQLLGGEVLPRSLLSITFESTPYLLVGMGDGTLLIYTMNDAQLQAVKRISLGTQPILLSSFRSKDVLHVFAASDHPTVIYTNNGKLHFSNVNVKEVNVMCPFDSAALPDCLALASPEELTIGTIDDIQKLHVQSVPLGEWPRRLAHDPFSHTLAVCTMKYTLDENHMEEVEVGFVRLIDDQSFDTLHAYKLDPFEIGCSIALVTFEDNHYYAVGTAYVHEEELEPHQGRILVFQVVLGKLVLVAEKEVKGAVYCLNAFQGKLLAGINSKTQVFKWSETDELDKELIAECGHHGHTLVLYMESRGDFIAVGDLMKSVSLLNYKALDGSIEEVAKDLNSNWMTAVDILDDDHILGAETDFNLFCVARQSGATTDEERSRLECVGEYHLGEFVNRFRHGSLVMQSKNASSVLFGTVSGMIGCILPLEDAQYTFLCRLQGALNKVVKGIGGFLHKDWRMFESKRHVAEAKNFIDGDLIETFLDLSKEHMQKAVELLNHDGAMDGSPPVTVDEVIATGNKGNGVAVALKKRPRVIWEDLTMMTSAGKDDERNEESNAQDEGNKHEMEAPISREDLLRSLDAELNRKRPDNYIITQLCLDVGEIPSDYRPRVWKALLLSGKTSDVQCDIYMAIDPDDINQRVIRADAPRTRPKEFEDRAAIEHCLLHVLTYYCRAKNIRYKQGMNEVLAPFLLLLWTSNDQENTMLIYQCFYTFIDKYLTNVYSDREFRSLQCSMRLLRLLLLYHDPRLCTYLDEHDMTPELYVTPWFMTLFARNTSPDILFTLWDAILLYDDPTLLHFVALSLLQDQRETLLKADAAELPQVLTSLGLSSVEHTKTLIQRALKTMQMTPSSFRKDVLTVCYKPLTDRTVSALKQIGNTSCLTLHPQELVSYMVQKVQGTLSTAMNMIILDCRSFQAFQEYHLSLSYHIDPDVVANAEAFRVLLDGFGRMKDCHFCFVGSKAAAAMHSDGDPVLSPSQDHEIVDDVSIGRFVMMFLQNGFQHVSKVQGGLEAIRDEFLNTLDDSVHEQLIVGEWVDDATDTLKDKAKRLIGKLPTQSALQQFQRLKSTLGKQLSKQPLNDVSQNPLAGDDEWVEVVVKSKEVLRRSSKSLSEDWKTVVFQEGKLGILFKGVDRSAITIDSIVPHGQAELAKVLERGDILETIDAASVRGLRFQAVMQMLQKTPRPVTLQFSRPPTRMFDTLDALSYPPHAPLLLRNGPYSLSIIWDHVPGATKYQLQYAMQSEYRFHPWSTLSIKNKDGQVLDHSTDANDVSGTVVGLEPGEKYLLRVRCGTASNWGTYSEPSVAMTTLETSRKVQSPRSSATSSSLVVFLVGECPDVVEKGLFYYRVLIGLRARSGPSYDAMTEEIALEKGSLIKCEEKIMRGPHVFVRLADTELWAFETTSDGAPVLERLAMEPFEKDRLTPPNSVEKPVFVAPSGLHLQAASATSIVVTWEALLDPTVTKYCIQFSKNKLAALWTTRDLVATENSCILTQLTPGTAYIVRVRAGYESGWGPYTATSAPCRTPDAPPGTPPSSTDDLDDGKTKLFNAWMEKAAQTAAGAVQQVARLTRTNSMDQQVVDERPAIKEPPLVINVEEMKQAKEEFQWFPARKLHEHGPPTPCELVVTNGYLLSVEPEDNRPGWSRIDERRRLKLLTKITSRRTISNSVVFHFKQHEEEDGVDQIGFIVDDRSACLEVVKQRFLAITAH